MRLWIAALAGVLSACEPVPPQSLADITFPDGFRYDTAVAVELSVESGALATDDVLLTVSADDGEPLFSGRASYAASRTLELTAPPGVAALTVTAVRAGQTVRTWTLPLEEAGHAVVTLD